MANGRSTLLDQEQVEQIRELYAAGGLTQAQVGLQFGVSGQIVSRVVRRTAPYDREVEGGRQPPRRDSHKRALRLKQIDEARRAYVAGQRDVPALAVQFGISATAMEAVLLAEGAYAGTGAPVMRKRREGKRLNDADLAAIREMAASGIDYTMIAAQFEIGTPTVTTIVNRKGQYSTRIAALPESGGPRARILSSDDVDHHHREDAITTNFLVETIREISVGQPVDGQGVRGQIDLVVATLSHDYDAERVRSNVVAYLTDQSYRPITSDERREGWRLRNAG